MNRNEIWFTLLEAAERVANPYFGDEDDAPGAFRKRVQKSFDDLREAIKKVKELEEEDGRKLL